MYRYACVTVTTSFAILLGLAAPAHASARCRPPHTQTLKSNDQVRVYDKRDRYGGRDVYACHYRTGERHYLGLSYPDAQLSYDEVSPILLRGARVAWKYTSSYRDGSSYYIAVRDMRTNEMLRSSGRAGTSDTCSDSDSCYSWEAYGPVVDRQGSAAWIATGHNGYGSPIHKVYKSDVTRHAELVDSGAQIVHDSLMRDGRTISWRHGDENRTAVFAR